MQRFPFDRFGFFRIAAVLVLAFFMNPAAPVPAIPENPAAVTGARGKMNPEIHITSDQLISRREDRYIEFSGNVRARQKDAVIEADLLTVYFKKENGFPGDEGADAESIERLVAAGNVIIYHENRKAFCEKAVYTSSDGLLVLTGEKVIMQEESGSITGDKIVFNRNTGDISVTGSSESRVEAVFEQWEEDAILPSGGPSAGDAPAGNG